MRRRWALALAGTVWSWSLPARAAIDLLKMPARASALAPRAMLLGMAWAGNRLVAVGERGVVVWSDDAGASWAQATVPVSVTLVAAHFVDARSGWAVGHDGAVLHSIDAGQTWALQFDGGRANAAVVAARQAALQAAQGDAAEAARNALADAQEIAGFGPSRPLLGLWFRDAARGWVVGAFGQVFHTTDGGRSWAYVGDALPNPDGLHCNSLTRLPDNSLAIAAEGGQVFRSRDDGRTWLRHDTGYKGHLYGVLSAGVPGALLAFGFGGHVLRSADDGQRWNELPKLTRKSVVGGLQLDGGRLLLVDRDRAVLASDDAGLSWRVSAPPGGRPLAAVAARLAGTRLPVAGLGGASLLALEGATR